MSLFRSNLPFSMIAFAQMVSLVGDFISGVAWIWYLTDRPNSEASIALVMSAYTIPQAALPILTGQIADTFDTRRLLLAGEFSNAVITLLIAVAMYVDRLSLEAFCIAAILLGTTSALLGPAYGVTLLNLIRQDQILNLSVARQGLSNSAWMLGPFAGGLAVSQLGPSGAVVIDACTFVVAFTMLGSLWLGRRLPEQTKHSEEFSVSEGTLAGLRFLRLAPGLLTIVWVYAISNSLNNVEAVIVPEIAREELSLGPILFSLLATTMAFGGILGTTYMSRRGSTALTFLPYVRGGLSIFGLSLFGVSVVAAGWQLYPLYLLLGITFSVGEVANSAVLQERTPPEIRGRVFGAVSTLSGAGNPVGFLLAGAAATAFGSRPTIAVAGGAILLLALWQLGRPSVRDVLSREPSS